jgi:predicted DNA-binding transcriptional regulator YafY
MEATLGTLILLRKLAEGPTTRARLLDVLRESGLDRDPRTLRRWLETLREAGFEVPIEDGRYELAGAPVRLAFDGHEALATLSVMESLAIRDPLYGNHLESAVAKLREALPEESLRFADSGRIEFALDFASDPPENPDVMDALRRATRQSRRVEIVYHSLSSDTVRRRLVEPVRLSYAQRAHRLYAYEREEGRVTEFRINRISEATMLPDKFSPEAHRRHLDEVRVRLSEKAFVALGKTVVPDDAATIEPLPDGGAIVSGTTPTVFWTVRDLAALGPEAEVLGGPKLRREFLSFLAETSARYSS